MIGTSYSYKNTVTFFAALDELPDEYLSKVKVVLVGRGGLSDEEKAVISKHPILYNGESQLADRPSKVQIVIMELGRLDDSDLHVVYSGALALVYISIYEGFGLPAAEALTSGTLCILAKTSSLPEVGGPASLYAEDPKNVQLVGEKLLKAVKMTKEERAEKIRQGFKHVEQFGGGGTNGMQHGWNEAAKILLEHVKGKKHRGSHCYPAGTDLKIEFKTSQECSKYCQCIFKVSTDSIQCEVNGQVAKQKHHANFICPQQFRDLADWTFAWADGHHHESISQEGDVSKIAPCLREGAIIYARGWELDNFFGNIYPNLKNKFFLITGESDLTVPFGHHMKFIKEDSKIIHWFGQNGGDIPEGGRFTHIPIGFNCFEHYTAVNKVFAQYKADVKTASSNLPELIQEVQKQYRFDDNVPISTVPQYNFKKWLLINFDPSTDGSGERMKIVSARCSRDVKDNWLPFTDCITKESGVRQYLESMYDIYKRNLEYPFWLSPRGNGLDCHRTWEALVFGRIPIIRKSSISRMFEDLPVVIVDDWNVINESFLKEKYKVIMEGLSQGRYKIEKLQFSYWQKMVMARTPFALVPENERPNRCWRPNT
jgi:hypothetical protein